MAIAQFQNLPIIFRLKIRVKFQIHGKIYKRTEKIFFRVFGNTRKKKIHGKNFRVLKKIPCIQKISVYFKYTEIFSVYCEEYTEIFWIHGIFFRVFGNTRNFFFFRVFSLTSLISNTFLTFFVFLNLCGCYSDIITLFV